ncbi:uncharacterized protein LOC119684843 [Teleopsis dalmanni]|uniref:uncharacterized protein LOC119663603 n=1 Tax=Teleopsis dalmanni TaxID=139649 RepID=UPI000D329386|nr:uncharacterized protein LOC119663603 [Teleopsis dalmanni]XP_037954900.1 uncharacterized protein LOC119684843 [Teleopsis dalmanni]
MEKNTGFNSSNRPRNNQRLIPLTTTIIEAMATFNDPPSEIALNESRLPIRWSTYMQAIMRTKQNYVSKSTPNSKLKGNSQKKYESKITNKKLTVLKDRETRC